MLMTIFPRVLPAAWSMTWSAPIERSISSLFVWSTPVTTAPKALATGRVIHVSHANRTRPNLHDHPVGRRDRLCHLGKREDIG